MSAPILLDRPEAVSALADELATVDRLAVDTEFHSEQRYHPELMTVQLAAEDGRAWVIDARRVDLAPLCAPLSQALVIVHGGVHDVALLRRAAGWTPARLLDTQRLAGLAGSPYPARLGQLLSRWLGQPEPPSRTLSDWSQRPLDADQLAYAAADALLLLPLARRLEEEVQALGRADWAREASLELAEEALEPARPLDAWRRWEVAPGLDADTRAVLAGLLAWRDAEARARDQPPHYLLGDSLALALARSRPRTLEELERDRRVAGGLRKRFGAALVACITRALDGPAPPPVPADAPQRVALLSAWAACRAAQTRLAAGLALPPALLQRVAEEGPAALAAWRAEALGEALAALWRGEVAVAMDQGEPRLVSVRDRAGVESGPSPR